jgi:hypothetical protein
VNPWGWIIIGCTLLIIAMLFVFAPLEDEVPRA